MKGSTSYVLNLPNNKQGFPDVFHSIPPGPAPSAVHRRTVAVSYGYGDGIMPAAFAAEDTVIVEARRPLTP